MIDWLLKRSNFLKKIFSNIKIEVSKANETNIETKNETKIIKEYLKESSKQVNEDRIRIARLEGIVSTLLNKSQNQVSNRYETNIETKNETKDIYEKRAIMQVRKKKGKLIYNKIQELLNANLSSSDLEFEIVDKLRLCSRATFYRILKEVRSKIKVVNN